MSIHRRDPKIFFPWERRRGLGSMFRRARGRQAIFALGGLAVFLFVRSREQRASEVRATRATIATAVLAMAAFRADHDAHCPPSLTELVLGGYLHELPRDAWGHPLRVVCPVPNRALAFDVSSDGPDGEPGGLDRVQ